MEVIDLIHRHYATLDEHRFDDMGANFCEDVQAITPVGEVTGRDTVLALISRTFVDYARLHHVVGNVLVDVVDGGDRVEVRFDVIATFGREDALHPTRSSGSVCRFDARREMDGWRISRMRITPVWLVEPDGAQAA